jgi:hypothetical protein
MFIDSMKAHDFDSNIKTIFRHLFSQSMKPNITSIIVYEFE